MNEQATDRRPADAMAINSARGKALLATPADIAAQLRRDAQSLKLTGSHLESAKDQGFYDKVAEDMAAAAGWLERWQDREAKLDSIRSNAALEGQMFGLHQAITIARGFQAPMPSGGGTAASWRSAVGSVIAGLQALYDSLPGPMVGGAE